MNFDDVRKIVVKDAQRVWDKLYDASPELEKWLLDYYKRNEWRIPSLVVYTLLRQRAPQYVHSIWTTATKEQEETLASLDDIAPIPATQTLETFTFARPGEEPKVWRHILFFGNKQRYGYNVTELPPYPTASYTDPREDYKKQKQREAEVREDFSRREAWKRRVEGAETREELLAIGEYPHRFMFQLGSYEIDPRYYPAANEIWATALRDIAKKERQTTARKQEKREIEGLQDEVYRLIGDAAVLVQISGQPRGYGNFIDRRFIFGNELYELANQDSKFALMSTVGRLRRANEPGDYRVVTEAPPIPVMQYANDHTLPALGRAKSGKGWVFDDGAAFDNDGQRLRKGSKAYKQVVGE